MQDNSKTLSELDAWLWSDQHCVLPCKSIFNSEDRLHTCGWTRAAACFRSAYDVCAVLTCTASTFTYVLQHFHNTHTHRGINYTSFDQACTNTHTHTLHHTHVSVNYVLYSQLCDFSLSQSLITSKPFNTNRASVHIKAEKGKRWSLSDKTSDALIMNNAA